MKTRISGLLTLFTLSVIILNNLVNAPFASSEVLISSATGDQDTQTVAWNSVDHQYLVLWHDAAVDDIRGALLDQNGNVIVTELPIVVDAERQAGPWIAYGGTGSNRGYLAVWIKGRPTDPTGTDVHGAWISPNGTVQSTFIVTGKTANQRAASVTYDPVADRFLVLWVDDEHGAANQDIWRALLLPGAGGGVYSAPAPIVTQSNNQRGPYARYDYGNSRYFMVWFDDRNGNNDVFGSRVDAAGNLLDGSGLLITNATGDQNNPRITDRRPADGINNFVLAWIDLRNGQADIWGALVDGNGVKVGSDFQIAGGSSDQRAASVDVDYVATDHALVSWIDNRNGTDYDIWRAHVDQTGTVRDEQLVVGQGTGAANDQRAPVVFYTDVGGVDNGFLIVWRDKRNGTDENLWGTKVFPLPDLVVTSVSGPQSMVTGTSYTASYTVCNDGTKETGSAFDIGFYLTPDFRSTPAPFATQMVSSLAAGQCQSGQSTVTIDTSSNFPNANTFTLQAKADNSNAVQESYESNNTKDGNSVNVTIGPDLVIDPGSVSGPSSASGGDFIQVSFTVRNQGSGSTVHDFNVVIYISSNSNLSVCNISQGQGTCDKVLKSATIHALSAGESYTGSVTTDTVLPSYQGQYYLKAMADGITNPACWPDGSCSSGGPILYESNENNNVGVTPITMQ